MNAALPYIEELTIAMPISNLQASIKWYTEVLGFDLLFKVDEIGWAEVQTSIPGVTIGLSQVEVVKLGGPTPTFGVSDVDNARAKLESCGVSFDGETMTVPDMVKLATFFDPDGNSLMFAQSLVNSA